MAGSEQPVNARQAPGGNRCARSPSASRLQPQELPCAKTAASCLHLSRKERGAGNRCQTPPALDSGLALPAAPTCWNKKERATEPARPDAPAKAVASASSGAAARSPIWTNASRRPASKDWTNGRPAGVPDRSRRGYLAGKGGACRSRGSAVKSSARPARTVDEVRL